MQNTTLTKDSHELNEPTLDILEEGLLHKMMLLFHLPTRLPGVLVVGLALVVAVLTGVGWWVLTGDQPMAQLIAVLLALFMAADMTLLLTLPQQRISYGVESTTFCLGIATGCSHGWGRSCGRFAAGELAIVALFRAADDGNGRFYPWLLH